MTEKARHESTFHSLWDEAWSRPQGRWPAVRWGLALLIPVAAVLWALSIMFAPEEPDLLRITVESQAMSETIEGASVTVGDVLYTTDGSGSISIDPVPAGTEVRVSAAGHETTRAEISGESGEDMTVSLSAVLVLGTVSDIVSGAPVGGAELSVLDAQGSEVASARTDESGTFVFKFIPEDAEIAISHDVYGDMQIPIDDRRSLHIQLDPPPVIGRAVDTSGEPVAGASVSGPQVDAVTAADGTFTLETVGQGTEITIRTEAGESAVVVVDGTDLGDIRLTTDAATPEASPVVVEGEG